MLYLHSDYHSYKAHSSAHSWKNPNYPATRHLLQKKSQAPWSYENFSETPTQRPLSWAFRRCSRHLDSTKELFNYTFNAFLQQRLSPELQFILNTLKLIIHDTILHETLQNMSKQLFLEPPEPVFLVSNDIK